MAHFQKSALQYRIQLTQPHRLHEGDQVWPGQIWPDIGDKTLWIREMSVDAALCRWLEARPLPDDAGDDPYFSAAIRFLSQITVTRQKILHGVITAPPDTAAARERTYVTALMAAWRYVYQIAGGESSLRTEWTDRNPMGIELINRFCDHETFTLTRSVGTPIVDNPAGTYLISGRQTSMTILRTGGRIILLDPTEKITILPGTLLYSEHKVEVSCPPRSSGHISLVVPNGAIVNTVVNSSEGVTRRLNEEIEFDENDIIRRIRLGEI